MNRRLTLYLCRLFVLCLLGPLTALAAPPGTHDWLKTLRPTSKAVALNLDDPAVRTAYHQMLEAAHVPAATQAALKQWTGKGAAPARANTDEHVFALLGFATDDAGATVGSSALIVAKNPTASITLTLLVTDPQDNIVAMGNREDKNGPASLSVTAAPGANPVNEELTAVATAAVLYADGSHQVYYVYGVAGTYPTAVSNVSPSILPASPDNSIVQVCTDQATAAGAPPEACSYVFASVDRPVNVQVPVKGSATFPAAIDVDAAGKPVYASASLLIIDPGTNAVCQYVDLGDAFLKDRSTKVSGATLSWAMDTARFTSTCPIADTPYVFALSVNVQVQGKSAWATISNAVTTSSVTTLTMPALRFVAGCVANGTAVRLANGTDKLVETLKVGDRLKSETGDLAIAAIAKGSKDQSVTFTLDNGDTLQVSLIHPVPTARGVVQAQALRLGDSVTTLTGSARVTRVLAQTLPKPLIVYDLVLTPAQVSSMQGSTFYAASVLVGDGAMKAALERSASHD